MIDGISAGKDNTMNAALEIEENPPIEEHKIVYDSHDMDEISAGMDNVMMQQWKQRIIHLLRGMI